MADPPTEIEQIRARHGTREGFTSCLCGGPLSCDASLLLAALSEAEAERNAAVHERERLAQREYERAEAAEARLEAVEGALRRIAGMRPEDHGTTRMSVAEFAQDTLAALAQEHTEPQEQPHGK